MRWAAPRLLATTGLLVGLLAGCGSAPATQVGPSQASSGRATAGARADTTAPGPSTTTGPNRTTPSAPEGSSDPPAVTGTQAFSQLPDAQGRLVTTMLAGPASGVRMRVWVWLPPQYDQPAYARTSFPALMLYPGGSGAGYNTWAGHQYGAQELVATGAKTGTVTPFVFVMPEMQLSERRDTECADLPGQPKVGTFLTVDVRRMVEANFRVLRSRAAWAAAGASTGAYCALRVVFNHPDQYAAAVSIDGYFALQTPLRGVNTPAVLAQDPAAIAHAAPPDVSVLVWSGGANGPDLRQARAFLAAVRAPTRAELRVLPGGRHLTSDFAKMMPQTFAFLSRQLSPPSP